MGVTPERLREEFRLKRFGLSGGDDYDPAFDLLDAAADEIERLRRENVAVSVHCSVLIEELIERGATQAELSVIAQMVRDNQRTAPPENQCPQD